jgi:LPXTG-motif cell wall-anchored protein
VVVLGVMAVGVGLIIWNYFRGDQAQNLYLWIGLGLIGTGFGLATQWR